MAFCQKIPKNDPKMGHFLGPQIHFFRSEKWELFGAREKFSTVSRRLFGTFEKVRVGDEFSGQKFHKVKFLVGENFQKFSKFLGKLLVKFWGNF